MKTPFRFLIGGPFLVLTAALLTLLTARAALLPEDPRNIKGKLDNGVTWIYRQHNNPPGKMALQVHVRTGSLNETEAQRGLAHFIEHMAFNGTENFAPGKLIPYFESIGMQFGADLNAYTSYDETVYMLMTPNTDVAQIDKALMVLSDYVFRESLMAPEIEKERGIVLEEARSRKSARERIMRKLEPQLYEGSRYATRLPIGEEQIISKAPKTELDDYYRAWYRPENITVVLVGDAPSDKIIPLIQKRFGEYKAPAPARSPHGPEFKPFTKERAIVVTDPEVAFCQVQMMNIFPGRPPTLTTEQASVQLVEHVASWIIGRRFDQRVKKGHASFRRAGAFVTDFMHDAVLAQGFAMGNPQDWSKMLEEVLVEVKRARDFGFSESEIALARKEILADAEREVRTEPTKNAEAIIDEIISNVNSREPVMSAQQDLEFYKATLPGISASEVSDTFKKYFAASGFAYVVTTSDKPGDPVPTREQVLDVVKKANAIEVPRLVEDNVRTNLLSKIPAPAKIIDQTVDDKDLGVTSVWLENGAHVHHRYMDYKKDSVLVSIALAGGQIEETATNVGVTSVAALAVNEAATSEISSTEMRDLMIGKNINVGASPAVDHLLISVTGSPLDLEAGMQEAYLLLKDGKIEEAAFKNWRQIMERQIEEREKNPSAKASEALSDLLSGGDPRRLPLKRPQVDALSLEAAQAWFNRLCKTAPIEVAVVGDIKLEDALPLVQRYIGALPPREREARKLDPLRNSPRPKGPLAREVKVDTVTPKAVAYAGFAGSEGKNISDSRALELASLTLSSRLTKQVREELAIVYSIFANSVPSYIYNDAGQFISGAPCDPANAAKVVSEVQKIFKDFAENGPTPDEIANAKKQIANSLDSGMREPGYWWGILRNLDLRKRDLAAEKMAQEDFQKFTAEQVKNAFAKYYKPERIFQVIALPTGKEEKTAAATATGGTQ
jgi:zinc protease